MQGMPSLPRSDLPKELLDPLSPTRRQIDLVADMDTRNQSRSLVAAAARSLIRHSCSSYQVSRVDELLCRSGEDTGQAFRGLMCAECPVGQHSANLVHIGQGQYTTTMQFAGQITLPRKPQPHRL